MTAGASAGGPGADTDGARRVIAHLDMDAFYASVELLRYPQLRGQPVVVGGRRLAAPQAGPGGRCRFARLGDYRGRGVVTTATYEARASGVHSGMGLMAAGRLAPEALLLPADFEAYRDYSRRFKEAVRRIAPTVEDRSIDEIYIDLTHLPGDPVELARRIRRAVNEATGLSCSLGLAPNKLLAKIGSELDKPDGLTVLRAEDLTTRVWPLDVKKINGIGPKATERLHALGIRSIADLAQADPGLLRHHFGANYAHWLRQAAHGIDERPVVTRREPKSISRESTFERDLHPRGDRSELTRILVGLCERVSGDLRARGYRGRTIGIKLRFDDFRTVTRDITLAEATDAPERLLAASRECLRKAPLDRRLRLLGVRAGKLEERGGAPQHPTGPRQATLPFLVNPD